MTGHRFSWVATIRGAHAAFFAAMFALPMLVDCGGQASCDDLCDNVLDKCSTDEYSDLVRNDCLEQCAQRSNTVPAKCALEKDDVLSCLADADSLDCGDPQQSAACATENAALNSCAFGSSNNGGGGSGGGGDGGNGGSTSSAPNGQSCQGDNECASGLCSWVNDTCTVPGDLGAVCERDNECASGLCSWVDDTCSVPAPLGEPCERDNECIDGLCNWSTEVCSELGASGAPCGRDNECLSNSCPNDVCQ